MGPVVLFDHVKALLDYFGVFLGLRATGEGGGGDVSAAWDEGEGCQDVHHWVCKDGMDKVFEKLARLVIAEGDSQALSGSTLLIPAGALAVLEVADTEVVGEFLGGEVAEGMSVAVQTGLNVIIDEMGKLAGC